jgi:phosphohistidine phosphatase
MDLLLVRCADLESEAGPQSPQGTFLDSVDDSAPRQFRDNARDPLNAGLSERGERNARRLANWLRGHAPRELQIVSSPARGARQMADLLAREVGGSGALSMVNRTLGPDAAPADILGAVGWPHDHSAALVVAHQPALGALASLLLTGHEAPLAFKKGALWWFSNRNRGGELQTVLRCALTPDLLKGGLRPGKNAPVEVAPAPQFEFPDVVELVRMAMAGRLRHA